MERLPDPKITSEFYQRAMLDELRGVRAALERIAATPQAAKKPTGVVELREPETVAIYAEDSEGPIGVVSLGTPIPDDFPGVVALHKAGIMILEDIPRNREALIAIKGIGEYTADEIAVELG